LQKLLGQPLRLLAPRPAHQDLPPDEKAANNPSLLLEKYNSKIQISLIAAKSLQTFDSLAALIAGRLGLREASVVAGGCQSRKLSGA
jgi:hypothetical protein